MKKFIFLAGLAIGFVVGSRAGRGPYESLERTARQVAEDPEVQRRTAQAKETAERVAHDTAETVKSKAPEVAENVKGKAQETASATKEKAEGTATSAKQRLGKDSGSHAADATDASSTGSASGEEPADVGGDGEVGEGRPLSS
ncbi:hypothetical protein ACFQS2_13110 [Brachybacterium sp. GCM10030267]|uniref:hypothetical protein n=1 Tax=unclassified Brachybacterium TaxID=2623841 RepID=UPI00360C5EE9